LPVAGTETMSRLSPEARGRNMSNDTRVLRLTVRRAPFEDIVAGRKKEEYRRATPYWTKRLSGKDFGEVLFSNGRSAYCDRARVEFKGMDRVGAFFRIHLGRVLEVTRKNQNRPAALA
jgi:hypothetical protein